MSFYLQSNVGYLEPSNKFCIDWNGSGTFAFTHNYTINIVDSYSMKIIQTLENNKIPITSLKWSDTNIYDSQLVKPIFKLACADESGSISIWNTFESKLMNELVESNTGASISKLNDLQWKLLQDKKEVLFTLYTSNKFVIWDPILGIKLWTKSFTANIYHFTIDPHVYGRVALLGTNFVEFVLSCFDEIVKEKPTQRLSLASAGTDTKGIKEYINENKNLSNSFEIFNKYFKNDDSDSKNKFTLQQNLSGQCIQIKFHSIYKDTLIIVYSKEILFIDLNIHQIVGHIQLDKNQSPFTQIYSCSQKNVLFILHENGCLSIRYKTENCNSNFFSSKSVPLGNNFKKIESDMNYQICAQSDQIRLSKNTKVFGMGVCPSTEKNILVLLSDGRVLRFELYKKMQIGNKKDFIKKRKSQDNLYLLDIFNQKNVAVKIVMTKMISNIAFKPFIHKMCPPLTKKNSKYWQPLLAIGCSSGNLAIYNILKNYTEKKITILNNSMTINGIEWISLSNIITWSYHASSHGLDTNLGLLSETTQLLVRNDIFLTDLRTGESRKLREGQGEESPIVKIKLSNLKQYLVILFKEQPFEIWDIKNFSLIKKVSKKSPTIKILEWCSIDLKKNDTKPDKSQLAQDSNPGSQIGAKLSETKLSNATQNENFVCIDINGLMYSFSVENNIIKDGGKILPEDGLLSHLTSIAIKKELIIFGDVDGNICVWNTKLKVSKLIPSKHGNIKKLKFAPGKENYLLLVTFVDRIKILEIKTQEMVSSFKLNSIKQLEILDTDWCASDKLVISFSNGCISVFDIFFKKSVDERKYLLSLSSNKTNQTLPEFLRNTNHIKRFYYQITDLLINETEFNYKSLDKTIEHYSGKNKPLSDYLQNANSNVKKIITSAIKNEKELTNLLKKVNAFARLAMYFNLCQFEKIFWTYLVYSLTDNESSQCFFELIQQKEFLLKSKDFRQKQYELFKLHKEKDTMAGETTSPAIQSKLLLCNEQNLVFNYLVETDSKSQAYLNSSFKACLITSLQTDTLKPEGQSNIKLVATNLIINGKIDEGIELLCLIGLIFDACRYLQDNGDWERAAWLAKLRLSDQEHNKIIRRWVDHLCTSQINNIEFAILLLISCKQYAKALEIMSHSIYSELNYFFLRICAENKLINVDGSDPSILSCDEAIENSGSDSVKNDRIINNISEELNLKITNIYRKKVF